LSRPIVQLKIKKLTQTDIIMRAGLSIKITLLFLLALMCNMTFAQEEIRLYEGAAPGSENWTQKETTLEYRSQIWDETNVVVLNVVDPTLTIFLPDPRKATGTAMIVCPGGGFSALSWDNEGPNVAKKLAEKGIAAFVLKYRIAYSGGTPEEVDLIVETSYGGMEKNQEALELIEKNNEITRSMSLSYKRANEGKTDMDNPFISSLGNIPNMAGDDARRAIGYVRKNAAKWNLNPDKIGMLGFSAGGILALDVAFNHDEQSKPNLIGVIYGAFVGKGVPSDPMPLFLAATQYEAIGNAAALYNSWCDAKLPAEIHSFTGSTHGFGYRNNGDSVNIWIELFYNFLKKTDFLK
jgi:dienelactone hydrolase